MLQSIRDKAQGWIAWVIVILISIPFALWGIQEYLGLGQEPVVATVAGAEVTQRQVEQGVVAERERLRNQLGESYDPEMFPEGILAEQVRDRLIGDLVLLHAADKWGMRVGDEMLKGFIQSQSYFQSNGRFDPQLYQTVLRNNGFSQARYEQTTRQELVSIQLRQSLVNSSFSTERELTESARLLRQQRHISFARIKAEDFIAGVEASDEVVQDFYARNSAAYTVPERIKVAYLVLDLDAIGKQVSVDEDTLRNYFEQNEDQYRTPEERQVRHILVKADGESGYEALAKTEALRVRLLDGEDFAAVAREASDDPGSAGEGGDLGWVQRGMMVEPFENAAFSLQTGVVSEPVLSQFGYHLIEVTDLREPGDTNFDDVRSDVETSYRRRDAENLYFDQAERLADIAYENPDSLKPAAEQLGLEIRTSDWFSRNDPPEELASPKVIASAFNDDVLVQRLNSERIEVRPELSVVLRVIEHQAERLKRLDEVRDQVVEAYRVEQAAKLAEAAGEAALAELDGGQTLAQLAEQRGWEIETPGAVQRAARRLSPRLLDKVFRLEHPSADRPSFGGVGLENGDYALITLEKVDDGSLDNWAETERERLSGEIRGQLAQGEFQAVVEELRRTSDIQLIDE